MNVNCVILGGGGHAKVLIDSLSVEKQVKITGILDADREQWGKSVLGVPVLGGDELLPNLITKGVNSFVVGLGGVGNNHPRARLFGYGLSFGLQPLTVIHLQAICSSWAEITPGAQILPGCVINAGAKIGANVIVNSGGIIEHDCVLEDHVHVATGARLASTVRVNIGAHIGAGATIKQCIQIGDWAVIGAGAVVVKDVSPYTMVLGVPARIVKQLEPSAFNE